MVLVRLAYAADLPTPDEALRALKDGARGRPVAWHRRPAIAAVAGGVRPPATWRSPPRSRGRSRARACPRPSPPRAAAPVRGCGGARGRAARYRPQGARWSGMSVSSASRRAVSSSASPKGPAGPSPTILRAPCSNGPGSAGWWPCPRMRARDLAHQARCRRTGTQGRRREPSARPGRPGEISRCADRQRVDRPTSRPTNRWAMPDTIGLTDDAPIAKTTTS